MVKLKRRLAYKSSVRQETIRVDAIKRAAKFLQNSEVYRAENVTVNFDDFENIINEATNDLIRNCEYDTSQENDERDSDDYSIIEIECDSVIDTSSTMMKI